LWIDALQSTVQKLGLSVYLYGDC